MTSTADGDSKRAEELERWLLREHGPLLKGAPLRKLLGYQTADAFRQAVHRQKVPVRLFTMPGEKVWCAVTRDVAAWMIRMEASSLVFGLPSLPSDSEEPMT